MLCFFFKCVGDFNACLTQPTFARKIYLPPSDMILYFLGQHAYESVLNLCWCVLDWSEWETNPQKVFQECAV